MRESCPFDYAQGDHPLFAHVRAQKRSGAILRQSFPSITLGTTGCGNAMPNLISTLYCFYGKLLNQSDTKPSRFSHTGVWGEPTKNGKEIFGFASPLPYWIILQYCYQVQDSLCCGYEKGYFKKAWRKHQAYKNKERYDAGRYFSRP